MTVLSAISYGVSGLLSAPSNDFFWSNPLFERDTWEGVVRFVKLALALGGALLLLYEIRARRVGVRFRERTRRRWAWVLSIVAFGAFFDFGNPNTRYSEFYHRHELYHYYVGSKFFEEVGYARLYQCTLVAEHENGRLDAEKIEKRSVRDLRTNLIKPLTATRYLEQPDECKKHFTNERWQYFKREVDWIYQSAAGDYYEGMQKDHGFNPPPVWILTGKLFGALGSASDLFFKFLASVDVFLYAGSFLLLNWAFGWRVMTVAALFWGANAPADLYWTGGAFLRQDWLFLVVAAVCLARKRYFFAAGFALTWSALLRIFPGLLVTGWVIIVGLSLLESIRRGPRQIPGDRPLHPLLRYLHPDHRKTIAGCLVALAVLVPSSIIVCGPASYQEFYQHTLKTLQKTPLTNQMGLESMLAHTWDGRTRFAQDDNLEDPFEGWKKGRLERFHEMRPAFIAIVLSVFAWTVWALRRTRSMWVGLALSLPLTMCLINITCYYFSIFLIGAVLTAARPQFGAPFLFASAIGKLLQWSPVGFYWVDDRWVAMSYLYFTLSLLMLAAYSRPFSRARLKAWWDGKPEPKGQAPSPSAEPAELPG